MIKKITIGVLIILTGLLTTCILIDHFKKEEVKVLSTNTIYHQRVNEDFNVPLYFSGANVFLKQTVIDVFVCSFDEINKLRVDLKEVNKYGKTAYDGVTYDIYIYVLKEENEINEFSLNDAYLKLETEKESLKMPIGSFSINKTEKTGSHMDLVELFALVGENPETINGLVMRLSNGYTDRLIIKNITFGANNVYFDINGLTTLSSSDQIKSDTSISSITNKKYEIISLKKDIENTSIELGINEEILVCVPIRYLKLCIANKLPIIITYEINGFDYIFVQENFPFFDNHYSLFSAKGVVNVANY